MDLLLSVHSDSSGGNFDWFYPSRGFSLAPCLSVGLCQPTFLHHRFKGSPVDLIIIKIGKMSSLFLMKWEYSFAKSVKSGKICLI